MFLIIISSNTVSKESFLLVGLEGGGGGMQSPPPMSQHMMKDGLAVRVCITACLKCTFFSRNLPKKYDSRFIEYLQHKRDVPFPFPHVRLDVREHKPFRGTSHCEHRMRCVQKGWGDGGGV